MEQFRVVVYKEDIGMFTAYGIKIVNNSQSPMDPYGPGPGKPHPGQHPGHHPRDPKFKDKVNYDVVLYTNPELTQSIIIYSDRNISTCRLVLNNFIKMVLNGKNYIDLNNINDKTAIKLVERTNDSFDEDDFVPDNIWSKQWKDPRKNPNVDIFDYTDKEPYGVRKPDGINPFEAPYECVDKKKKPLHDGEVMSFGPMKDIERSVTKTIPNYLDKILKEITPDERKPEHKDKIISYFGNGGCAMGGSVRNSMSEFSDTGLKDLCRLNHRSTYPETTDKITIVKTIKNVISEKNLFFVNMVQDCDWCFFMIPDKYMREVQDFNWYYFDETTKEWVEAINQTGIVTETGYTYQSNGIRYYYSVICMPTKYSVVFAKSGSVIEIAEDTTPDSNKKSVYEGTNIGLNSTGKFYIHYEGDGTITVVNTEDETEVIDVDFSTSKTATVSGLTFDVIYAIEKDGEIISYVRVIEDATKSAGQMVQFKELDGVFNYSKQGVYTIVDDDSTTDDDDDTTDTNSSDSETDTNTSEDETGSNESSEEDETGTNDSDSDTETDTNTSEDGSVEGDEDIETIEET